MSAVRVAQLHRRRAELLREVAEVDLEIASALDAEEPEREAPRRRVAPQPTGEIVVDDVTRARARRLRPVRSRDARLRVVGARDGPAAAVRHRDRAVPAPPVVAACGAARVVDAHREESVTRRDRERALLIQRAVAEAAGVSVVALRGRGMTPRLALARRVVLLLARRRYHASYPELGRMFGRAHAVARYGVRRADEDDAAVAALVERAEALLDHDVAGAARCA